MSVTHELNLPRLPSNLRVYTVDENKVVYFRSNALITLNPRTGETDSREFFLPHGKCIKAIACHPKFTANQLVAVAFDSGGICLYDFATDLLVPVHNEHRTKNLTNYMGLHMTEQGTIISVVENTLVRHCSVTKKTKVYNDILPKKFKATEMLGTPLDANLLAIGSFCGLVVVVSLKDMTLKYSFRGHNYQITAIVWMPNIENANCDYSDDCFDVYNDDHFRDDFGTGKRSNKGDTSFGVASTPPPQSSNTNFDFVEACQALKEELMQKKQDKTPQRPTQPERDECQQKELLDNSDGDLSSGFSNESNASSNLENRFEKIELNDAEDLSLVTLDQHMNVWVWDVKLNCAKGSFRIKSQGGGRSGQNKKSGNNSPTLFLLDDQRTIVGNTHTGGFFSLQLGFDSGKLDYDYHVTENNSNVLGAFKENQFLAYFPYRTLRLIEFVKAKQNRVVHEMATYNSMGRTIAVSPVNPMKLTIGTHEICFFDLPTVSDRGCNFTTYYKNVKSMVVCLAWHPTEEILAFGTMEGRIGLYNAQKDTVEILKPFSGDAIYDLCFGVVGEAEYLFARCFKGTCVAYFNKFAEFKYILKDIKDVSALFMDNSTENLFVGTNGGNVHQLKVGEKEMFLPTESHVVKGSKKSIRAFSINCDQSLLAVASKSPDLVIIPTEQMNSPTPPSVITLKGHSEPIIWVDFSRKNGYQLISTSYDNTIRLWDVSKNRNTSEGEGDTINALETFQFNILLKYAIYSPLNEDCLIVGTQATAFYVFNMKEKTKDFPPKVIQMKRNEVEKDPSTAANEQKTVGNGVSASKQEQKQITDSKNNETTIFYLAKKESTKKALQCLKSMVLGDEEEKENSHFLTQKIFSEDSKEIKKFLEEETKNYKSSNMKSRGPDLVSLMTGNMRETIVEHMKGKTLTDEIVAMAPMISYNFWKLCLEAFVLQLIEEGQPLKAVLYLLGVHKVDDALNLLIEKSFFREAWILAKLKKQKEAQIFQEIHGKWIQNLDTYGDYEAAAIISVGVGDLKGAVEQLEKRRDEQLTEEHHKVIQLMKGKLVK